MSFRLYPEERHWWSFGDYQAVLDVMRATGAKRILEFGPGSSTLALIEGGAEQIDTCEDDPHWAQVYGERLVKKYPGVRLHTYSWAEEISIPPLDGKTFDLALIDGPRGTERRPPIVRYAMARCAVVFVSLEEHNTRPFLRPIVKKMAKELGMEISIEKTGPLSGAFATIRR